MTDQFSFLFDECLTPALVGPTLERGHYATHVNSIGLKGSRDRSIAILASERDLVFVTNDGGDYRAIYRQSELHSGLVVILPSVPRQAQIELFLTALDAIEAEGDLVNLLVEVDADGVVSIRPWAANAC